MTFDPKRYAEFRKAVLSRRTRPVSQEYHSAKPTAIGTHIPLRGRRRKLNRQGITKVKILRLTEFEALLPLFRRPNRPYFADLDKLRLVDQAEREVELEQHRRRKRGKRLMRGGARLTMICGKTGLLMDEVKRLRAVLKFEDIIDEE